MRTIERRGGYKIVINKNQEFEEFKKNLDNSGYDEKYDCRLKKNNIKDDNEIHSYVHITNHNHKSGYFDVRTENKVIYGNNIRRNKSVYTEKTYEINGFKCIHCFKLKQCKNKSHFHETECKESSNLTFFCVNKCTESYYLSYVNSDDMDRFDIKIVHDDKLDSDSDLFDCLFGSSDE